MASSMSRCTAAGSGGGSDGLFEGAEPDKRVDARGDDFRGDCEVERDFDLEADARRGGILRKDRRGARRVVECVR